MPKSKYYQSKYQKKLKSEIKKYLIKKKASKVKICPICKKRFQPRVSYQVYCSTKCCRNSVRKEKKWKPKILCCLVCSKKFRQKTTNQKYCSKKCQDISTSPEWQFEHKEELKNYWLKLRFEVFKRDNFTCQYCGRNVKKDKIKICCDHIIPRKKGGKDTIDNLTTACEDCNLGKRDVLLTERLLVKDKNLSTLTRLRK